MNDEVQLVLPELDLGILEGVKTLGLKTAWWGGSRVYPTPAQIAGGEANLAALMAAIRVGEMVASGEITTAQVSEVMEGALDVFRNKTAEDKGTPLLF